MRQTVLRLAFSEPLKFTPEGAYGTPKTILPFRVLGGFAKKNCEMVRQEGKGLNCQFNSLSDEEWSNLFDTLEEWERYLAQVDSKSLRCDDEHFRP